MTAFLDPTGIVSHDGWFHNGQSWKPVCRVATTANITISTALNAGDTIDGVTLAAGDRVLVKDQSTASQNGIYIAGPTPIRAYDMDQDQTTDVVSEEIAGAFTTVAEGTLNGGKVFRTTNPLGDTIGTDAIVWEEWSGGGGGTLFYNVQDYGAVGDGTTDDTTAITDTFDAADATDGGIIYFPPTTAYYKITSRIERTTGSSKYHLLGGGSRYGSARVHQATSNTGAFRFAPGSNTANRVMAPIIENLVVSGAGGASSGRGIEVTNDGHIVRCFVFGFYEGIVLNNASFYSSVRDTTVTDCDNVGIWLVTTNNTTIDGCRLTGLFSTGSAPIGTLQHGIIVTGGFAQRITNCSIEYFTGYGIAVEGGGPIVIQGNYFETQQSSSGFADIWLGNTTDTSNAWVVGNYFQGDGISGFNAIKLDHAVAFHILSNRFGVNAAIGIAHTGSSSAGFVWGNVNSPAGTFTLPSDTVTNPGGAAFATPAIALGTAAAAGAASTVIRSDATIVAFDATAPVTQALGDSAATGSAAVASRRDHKHGMPALSTATPLVESGSGSVGTGTLSSREDHVHPAATVTEHRILLADGRGTPFTFDDLLQADDGSDFLYSD